VLESSLLVELTVQIHVPHSSKRKEANGNTSMPIPKDLAPVSVSILLEISIANGAVGW